MDSFSRYSEKNKYGGYTWMFKFEKIYHIFIYSTSENSFVIDFKEWGLFKYRKTHFSFTSNNSLIATVEEAFHRGIEFLENHPKFQVNRMMFFNKMNNILSQFENSRDPITKRFIY